MFLGKSLRQVDETHEGRRGSGREGGRQGGAEGAKSAAERKGGRDVGGGRD